MTTTDKYPEYRMTQVKPGKWKMIEAVVPLPTRGTGPAVGPLDAPVSGQSRRKSLLETVTSTAIGFAVSLVLTATVMPAFGYQTTWSHDFWITFIFTVASIVRGYVVRRAFNR